VEVESLDPGRILAEVEALMQPLALKKGIDFQCTGPEVPLQMQSDARKIRQILVNLVTNAIKFTKKGEVKLRLERVGDDILYHVSDSGIGIAPEHQEKIFDAFWRVETRATRATDGTGLGLSVSRRLALFLGGDLTVRSELNRGSTFVLRLPAAADLIPQRSKEPAGARPLAHTA
jgi:signal transduction histidine kinase